MAMLGSDFDPTTPTDSSPISQGAQSIRDFKQRVKDFVEVSFDPDTGILLDGAVTASKLATTGVSAGTYKSVTVNTRGLVTAGTNPTTLSGFGITDGQPLDATLTALAAVTTAANKIIYWTALDAPATTDLTAFARTLLDDADAAAMRSTLGLTEITPFHVTSILTSAAGGTAVDLVPSASVPAGKKIYLQGFLMRVNGATNWATASNVKIRDKNASPVDFVTVAVAALTGNTTAFPHSSNVTLESAYLLGTGGTAANGLEVKADVNGTGSDLYVSVWGVIK